MKEVQVLIVGAGPAGLATAACLSRRGISFEVVERANEVGSSWRNHYRRLHLHTARDHSSLPFTPLSSDLPTYVPRQSVVDYLDDYAQEHQLQPHFGVDVRRVRPDGARWIVESDERAWSAHHVVVATGYNRVPHAPTWPGRTDFSGQVLHSHSYRTGDEFRGNRVLVVGAGNSGAEIALDLCEQGAQTTICIRSPIIVVPRDLFGIPAQVIGIRTSRGSPRLSDRAMRVVSRFVFGDLAPWGIKIAKIGPLQQIREQKKIPLIDVGTIAKIKVGAIDVVPGVERFTSDGVVFRDGVARSFDAVIFATGYRTGLQSLFEDVHGVLDDRGYPLVLPSKQPKPGLHFVGFSIVSTGLLREIAIQAQAVADVIANETAT